MRILAEKDWESDANVRFCGKCSKGFGLMNRKSHCRCCGRVFCGDCVMHFEGMLEAPGASSPAKGTTKACNGCIVAERRKTAAAAAKSTSATNDESPLAQSSSFAGSPSTTFTNNDSMVRDSSRRESVAPGESSNAEPIPGPPTTDPPPSAPPLPKSDDGQGGAAALHRDPHSEPAALQPHHQEEEGSTDAKAASSVPLDDETTTTTTTKVEGTSETEKAEAAEAAPPPLYSNLSFSAGSLEKTATMVDFCDDCGCLLDRCICPPKPEGAGSTTTTTSADATAAASASTAQQPSASTTTTTTAPPPPPRPVNTVVLVIRRGEKLINVDGFGQGLSDPYVIVLNRDGTELYRTCVIDDNLNPQWPPEKATCTWTFADASTESLTLQVWDKDTVGTDDFMGEAVVPAMQFLHVLNGEVSAPLQPRVNETSSAVKKHAGKLGMLTFAWLTTPAPVDEEEEAEEKGAAESGKVEDTAATAEADVARSPPDEANKDPIAAEGGNKEEIQPSHKEEENRSRASQEEENGMANSHAQCDTVGQASPGGSSTAAPSDRQPAGPVEEVEEVEPSATNMEESVAIFPAPLAAASTTQPTASSAAPKAASYVPPTTEARTALQRATRFILPQEHIVFCLFAGKTRHFRLQRRFVILTSHGNLLYTDDEKNELKGNLSLRGKALHSVLKDYQSSNCKFTVVCDGKDYPFTTEKDEDRKEFVRLLPTVL